MKHGIVFIFFGIACSVILGYATLSFPASKPDVPQPTRQIEDLADAVAALQAQNAAQQAEIYALKAKLGEARPLLALRPYIRVEFETINGVRGPHIIFEGTNIHVRSGSGSTSDGNKPTGLGNLIVGYNEEWRGPKQRSGAHNIVLGSDNQFLSFGGLVAGHSNTIYGEYASVTGGKFNTARGEYSNVSEGYLNTATGSRSSISGGGYNTASGFGSSISGGEYNVASGWWSSVSGGLANTASGNDASISGGERNTARGSRSSASGGSEQIVEENAEWTAGSSSK